MDGIGDLQGNGGGGGDGPTAWREGRRPW